MANSRSRRGMQRQDIVAEYFREGGWVNAESIDPYLPGKDIINMPGWSIEAKATRNNPLPAALKQAAKAAEPGEIPVVVWCPNGYGEKGVGEWIVAFRFEDARELMRVAEGWVDMGQPQHDPLDDEPDLDPIPCGHDPEKVWFSRSICPDPCGSMHYHCEECGRVADRNGCALEAEPGAGASLERRVAVLEGWVRETHPYSSPLDLTSIKAQS